MASKSLAAAACLLLITEAAAHSQQPAAGRLEDRVREYVARFEQEAAALVAEEHYVQRLRVTRDWRPQGERVQQLRADYVLVKPADSQAWLGYRDIFEVDGRAVRDREQRVVKVLSGTAPDSRERALAFVDEGARYNLGPARTTNVPTMPLQLLAGAQADRFTIRVPDDWERKLHFIFPEPPSSVLRQESSAGLSVTYGDVPDASVPVPLRMIESVAVGSGGSSWSIQGTATYSKYRRFQTSGRIR